MKNKLRKVVMGFFVLVFISVFSLPLLVEAASTSYSFTMDNRVVDGSVTGKYHKLSSGNAYLTGSQYVYSTDSGYAKNPLAIGYELRNKTTRNSFGSFFKAVPSRSSAYPTKISKTKFSKSVGGGTNYYLIIWKGSNDGNNVKGSGTVSN
ncbi:hypothetical protein HB847_06975 [Listeria booriae]|uniref:Uncharacterized protein n=1 Tax=Listeria booriae TaxID=1552123 RepID=A0A841XY01_9LIST|nr:hypothetical protein [Listeria booriae]MBC1372111.1 hypothetical protein [Listeria booriae]